VQYIRHCGELQNVRNLRETGGAFSDSYFLARRHKVPNVNLSVGYYLPHTSKENLDLYAFDNCIGWVLRILDNYRPGILG